MVYCKVVWLAQGYHLGPWGPGCSGMHVPEPATCWGPVPTVPQAQGHPEDANSSCTEKDLGLILPLTSPPHCQPSLLLPPRMKWTQCKGLPHRVYAKLGPGLGGGGWKRRGLLLKWGS